MFSVLLVSLRKEPDSNLSHTHFIFTKMEEGALKNQSQARGQSAGTQMLKKRVLGGTQSGGWERTAGADGGSPRTRRPRKS